MQWSPSAWQHRSNAIVAGHAQLMDLACDGVSAHHCGFQPLKMLLRLHLSGLEPDLYTFSIVLIVCSSLAAVEQGETGSFGQKKKKKKEQVRAQTIKPMGSCLMW